MAAQPPLDGHCDTPEKAGSVQDDRLRLVLTSCHPALSMEARVALTLRLLGGPSTKEVARAFLVAEPTMAPRLVSAKHKIKPARIPYRVPADRAAEPLARGPFRRVPDLHRRAEQ
jgi:RNA polymerase sigma-70 factor (ECF subfamily)